MIPLTTVQGLPAERLRARVAGRPVYVWGSSSVAREVLVSLRKARVPATALVDSRAARVGAWVDGVCTQPVDSVLLRAGESPRPFLVLAAPSFVPQAQAACTRAGLKRDEDFVSYLDIARPVAAIDVAGMCNLACPACPRGNTPDQGPRGLMTLDSYQQVLARLLEDVPGLATVELFTFGEPFLNPDLARMVRHTQPHVPCRISTNLTLPERLEEVLDAQPTWLEVTLGGWEDTYERAMGGGSWSAFLANLERLAALARERSQQTTFTVRAYPYRFAGAGFESKVRALCARLGLEVAVGQTYLSPYDAVLDHCEGRPWTPAAAATVENLPWDLDAALALARHDAGRPCLNQRIFPIINWDRSVSLCHSYFQPRVAPDYLDISWDQLLERRHQAQHCHRCQAHALHRLDLDVLARRHPQAPLHQTPHPHAKDAKP